MVRLVRQYGFGVEIWDTPVGHAIGHAGSTPASAALMLYVPERDIAIVAMSNDEWADQKSPISTLLDEVLTVVKEM
jgi:CubicO group peptidase (beta-lactamase class C family)